MNNPIGTIYNSDQKVVIVHNGSRGARGLVGEDGIQGEQGDSFVVRGFWVSGSTYAPLDAVNARSSVSEGLTSLYIQLSSADTAVSTTEPYLDPARWTEIGVSDLNSTFGGIWTVEQTGHPFRFSGQPVTHGSGGYELGSASTYAIGVVREVINSNAFVLQSTGGISEVDPRSSASGEFRAGEIYYVSGSAGLLTDVPPAGAGQVVSPIYVATTLSEGVVLPWAPVEVPAQPVQAATALTKFYFTAEEGQTVFTGVDDNGAVLDMSGAMVDVFLGGLNLREVTQYTNTETTVTLASPAASNETLEVWAAATSPLAAATRVKADVLVFDGTSTIYILEAGGDDIPLGSAQDFDVYLDGNPQEPSVDYTIIDAGGGQTAIRFTIAPEQETSSWIVYGVTG